MSANSNNKSDVSYNEGRSVMVEQSSALQVEMLGTNLAIGGLQEQIESGEQIRETADTQQVDSNEDMDDDELSSSDKDGSEDAPVVLPTPATRAEELQTRMKGGVHQIHCPVWIFEGRLATPAGNKQDVIDVVTDSDKCPGLAASVGYHTIIRPCVEGVAQAALALNLFGDRGESAQALRNCILGLCFRDLAIEDLNMWERHVQFAHMWP